MATSDFDAVVYGAGPVGAAVALGLQQRGHRVVVLEKRTEYQVIGDAGKSINLSLSTRGNALMKQLGVYDDLLSTLVPMVSRIFAGASIRAPLRLLSWPVNLFFSPLPLFTAIAPAFCISLVGRAGFPEQLYAACVPDLIRSSERKEGVGKGRNPAFLSFSFPLSL